LELAEVVVLVEQELVVVQVPVESVLMVLVELAVLAVAQELVELEELPVQVEFQVHRVLVA
jgi:hypothetical protein